MLLSTTQMRSYAGEADIEAMMKLQNACEAVDQFGYWLVDHIANA